MLHARPMTVQVQIRGGLSVLYRVRHVCCLRLLWQLLHGIFKLLLVSVTVLGAIVSAEPTSNVVTPEGSELSDPSVGHEFKATYAANLVHDLQQQYDSENHNHGA